MSLVRRIARPLLAVSFIAAGADAVLHPRPKAEPVRPLVDRFAPVVGLPADAELLVRVTGALQVGAGVLFALGRMPRVSALVLAAGVLPSTSAEGAFWREKDPQARHDQRAELLRRAALLGGALLGTVDTERSPGQAWRGRRAVKQAEKTGKQAEKTGKQAEKAGKQAKKAGRRAARDARCTARRARTTAELEARQDKLDARLALRAASTALPR